MMKLLMLTFGKESASQKPSLTMMQHGLRKTITKSGQRLKPPPPRVLAKSKARKAKEREKAKAKPGPTLILGLGVMGPLRPTLLQTWCLLLEQLLSRQHLEAQAKVAQAGPQPTLMGKLSVESSTPSTTAQVVAREATLAQ